MMMAGAGGTKAKKEVIKMENYHEREKVPEFDIFKRLERLEEITNGEFTAVTETLLVAIAAFWVAFLALSTHYPEFARKYKDDIVGSLQRKGLNRRLLDMLREISTDIVDQIEKK